MGNHSTKDSNQLHREVNVHETLTWGGHQSKSLGYLSTSRLPVTKENFLPDYLPPATPQHFQNQTFYYKKNVDIGNPFELDSSNNTSNIEKPFSYKEMTHNEVLQEINKDEIDLNQRSQIIQANTLEKLLAEWKMLIQTMKIEERDQQEVQTDETMLPRSNNAGSYGNAKSDMTISESGTTLDMPLENIRNFSIIAHVDHGKSTLADRLLEVTGALAVNPGNKQVLDRLQVERDRGITVKAQTASIFYQYEGKEYLLNLIDTPGHVDFSNEVSRSLSACQGVILLVDANQGVQAQTVANFHLAESQGLVVLPVLNKIDLPNANPEQVKDQLFNLFTVDPDDVLLISAKMGTGIRTVLEAIIKRVPYPPGNRSAPLRALIFDSWFDKFRGAMALVYIRDGQVQVGDEVCSAYSKKHYSVRDLGILRPHEEPKKKLVGGQVGYLVCNMRSVSEAHIGDTLHLKGSAVEPLTGFTPARPMVYAGLYPMDQSDHTVLKSAIEKLSLNDPAVTVTVDSSPVLGHGWRIGFLGLLHLEVFNQRLEQEHGAEALMTAPSVPYKIKVFGRKNIEKYGGEEFIVSDPSKFPEREVIKEISEPMVQGTVITPVEYISKILAECLERRGKQTDTSTIDNTRVMLQFHLPLSEIIVDFHDNIKALTSGFASFDYEDIGFVPSNMVKLDILMNGEVISALSTIVHESKAMSTGRRMCEKLVDLVPRQQIPIAIQAAVGSKVLARETVKAYRKDVTAKLYGGDVTRKMKLLHKQAKGKKKMKKIANINLPKEVFLDYMKR